MQVILSEQAESPRQSSACGHGADSVKSYLQEIGRIPMLTAAEEITLGQQVQTRAQLLAAKAALAEALGRVPSDADWAKQCRPYARQAKSRSLSGRRSQKAHD